MRATFIFPPPRLRGGGAPPPVRAKRGRRLNSGAEGAGAFEAGAPDRVRSDLIGENLVRLETP
jgi:hypothetical protein